METLKINRETPQPGKSAWSGKISFADILKTPNVTPNVAPNVPWYMEDVEDMEYSNMEGINVEDLKDVPWYMKDFKDMEYSNMEGSNVEDLKDVPWYMEDFKDMEYSNLDERMDALVAHLLKKCYPLLEYDRNPSFEDGMVKFFVPKCMEDEGMEDISTSNPQPRSDVLFSYVSTIPEYELTYELTDEDFCRMHIDTLRGVRVAIKDRESRRSTKKIYLDVKFRYCQGTGIGTAGLPKFGLAREDIFEMSEVTSCEETGICTDLSALDKESKFARWMEKGLARINVPVDARPSAVEKLVRNLMSLPACRDVLAYLDIYDVKLIPPSRSRA